MKNANKASSASAISKNIKGSTTVTSMMTKPVIVGIDPGTTTAYAALSVDGDVRAVGSGRNVDMAWLNTQAIQAGKPVLVGCDKKNAPDTVEKFGRGHGARVAVPDDDLSVKEKKRLANHSYDNDHERDALASARFAYNEYSDLLARIRRRLHDPEVYEDVLSGETSVDDAMREEETNNDPDPELRYEVKRPTKELEERDATIAQLRERIETLEEQRDKLRDENERLRDRIDGMPVDDVVEEKEHTIQQQGDEIAELTDEIRSLEEELDRLKRFLAATHRTRVKKLHNLSRNTAGDVTFHQGDVVYVEDPNVAAEPVLEELRGTVRYIIHDQPLTTEHQGFFYVNSDAIALMDGDDFALVDMDELEDEAEKQQLLEKVVLEYKEERSH